MVDEQIGIVLDTLRDAGLESNTLIVFTSDHGDMDSAHKLEHKSILYEESVRIPFIMSLPGAIPKEPLMIHFISNGLDLLLPCATCRDRGSGRLPGRSVRPLAEGKAAAWRDFVVSETECGRMVARTGSSTASIIPAHREQLTDLRSDPGEMKNLAEDPVCKDTLDRHRQLLKQWVKDTGDRIAATYINGT
jgi:choline-sulfatase